jgi:hypothetical protein
MDDQPDDDDKEYKVDKAAWDREPWDSEPDRVDFTHAGLPCLALRHPEWGSWCAYVAVPKGHPAYGVDPCDSQVDVDANLNYGAACGGLICRVPAPGEPDDVWWLGWDFAHIFDSTPGRDAFLKSHGIEWPKFIFPGRTEVYRDLPYVRGEIERVAEQLAAMPAKA